MLSVSGSVRTRAFPTLKPNRPERSRRAIKFRSFSALKDLPSEPPWLWRGYLAPGSLTMLAGHPFAGKSMLVGGLLRAMQDGAEFLGRLTSKTTALVISEEDEGALRQRANVLGLLDLNSEYVARSSGSLSSDWAAMVKAASDHARAEGHGLLVVDTFPGLAGLAGDEENDEGAVGERLRPLQRAAGDGLAVLFLHHMNRYGQPRGSKALSGVVDASIRFSREKGGRFRLTADSRFPTATPASWRGQLVQEGKRWHYEPLSTTDSASTAAALGGDTKDRLFEVIQAAGRPGVTYDEIHLIPGLSKDIAKRHLPHWRGSRVQAMGAGTKGDPLRWYVPAMGAVRGNERGVTTPNPL